MSIILLGFMGAGKTTLGPVIAEEGGLDFVDLDAVIAERAGRSIPDLFREGGEAAFRDLESAALARYAARDGLVLATGGGVVEREGNHRHLKSGYGVYLFWPWEDLQTRLQAAEPGERPLRDAGEAEWRRRWRRREPLYRRLSCMVLDMREMQGEKMAARQRELARRVVAAAG